MNPAALYDALNCSAQAVDEAYCGRPAQAMKAWLAAREAAARAFRYDTREALALAVIVAASGLTHADEPWGADLWRALDTASLASLIAEDGDTDLADETLMKATGLAAHVPCRDAFAVVLTAIWDASRDGVPA